MQNIYIKFLLCFFLSIFFISIESINAKNLVIEDYEDNNFETLEYIDLNKALKIAIVNNSNIKVFTSKLKQANKKVLQCRSYYFPNIAIKSTIATKNSVFTNNIGSLDVYNLGIKASWIFFNGFKTKFENIVADYDEQIARTTIDNARRLLLLDVSKAFHKAQLFQENIKIGLANEAFNKRLLSEAEAKYNAGAGSLNEILNFRIRLNDAKIARKSEEIKYKISINELALILGISDSVFISNIILAPFKFETNEELLPPNLEEFIDSAVNNRPDVNIRKLLVKRANTDIYASMANKYPKINIAALFGAEKTGDIYFDENDISLSVCVELSYNFFDGGFSTAYIEELKERKNEMKYKMHECLYSAKMEIKNAILNVLKAQTKVIYKKENTKLIKQRRDLIEKEYITNCNSLVQLNEIQTNLVKSESKLAVAIIDLKQAWINLKLLIGEQIC